MHSLSYLTAALLVGASTLSQAQVLIRPPGKPGAATPPPPAKPRPSAPPPTAAAKPAPDKQFAVTVSGSVVDAEGLPLPGAAIWHTRTREVLAVANGEGEFLIRLPSNTPVQLTCGYAGYADYPLNLKTLHRYNELVVNMQPATK